MIYVKNVGYFRIFKIDLRWLITELWHHNLWLIKSEYKFTPKNDAIVTLCTSFDQKWFAVDEKKIVRKTFLLKLNLKFFSSDQPHQPAKRQLNFTRLVPTNSSVVSWWIFRCLWEKLSPKTESKSCPLSRRMRSKANKKLDCLLVSTLACILIHCNKYSEVMCLTLNSCRLWHIIGQPTPGKTTRWRAYWRQKSAVSRI